ncbi:hypothetical protein GPSY_2106 [Paraglaciecola psychrophila 170]|nr:hypothetical protein GPSY_2106 [Paraglaciecola psychrophila 170]
MLGMLLTLYVFGSGIIHFQHRFFTIKGSGSNLLALTGVLVDFVVSDILVTTIEVVHDGK